MSEIEQSPLAPLPGTALPADEKQHLAQVAREIAILRDPNVREAAFDAFSDEIYYQYGLSKPQVADILSQAKSFKTLPDTSIVSCGQPMRSKADEDAAISFVQGAKIEDAGVKDAVSTLLYETLRFGEKEAANHPAAQAEWKDFEHRLLDLTRCNTPPKKIEPQGDGSGLDTLQSPPCTVCRFTPRGSAHLL